jgi:pseudouridine-5'-phosphate glycosidase
MKAPWRIDTPQEAARVFEAMIEMNVEEAMVLANPVEEALSIGPGEIDAMMSAIVQWSQGKDVTPLLLSELRRMSGGRTLEANRSLLLSNTALAARIAVEMASE